MAVDGPIIRRPIDNTGWDLVFTRSGKYFFHDTIEKISKWKPSENLFEYLQQLPNDKIQSLFDPENEYVPEDENSERDEDLEKVCEEYFEGKDGLEKDGSMEVHQARQNKAKTEKIWSSKKEHEQAIENFKSLLRNFNFDPFSSWSDICMQLAEEPLYQAIPTDKERKSIFDDLCPELTKLARNRRMGQIDEAQRSWKNLLHNLTLYTASSSWVEFSRGIKKECWYKLLDNKMMEKEYRARLDDLRTRNIIYQIPK